MEKRENQNVCIFTPLCPKMDKRSWSKIAEKIEQDSRLLALDLSYVQDCTIEFIEGLKEISQKKNLGVFNIPSDIFVLFNVMNIDKSVKLFVNESDFEYNCRQIINRKFSLI